MNIYKISCHSLCGSYFESYLQSVSVIAPTEKDAIANTKAWLKNNDESFTREEKHWHIENLGKAFYGVFDHHSDSDY